VKAKFSNAEPADPMNYLNDLKSLPSGTVLYDVYGWDAPEQLGGKEILMGTLQLDGSFTKSKFGDEVLFIRHELTEDDMALKPDWTPYYDKFSLTEDVKKTAKCPYLEMLKKIQSITAP